MQLHYPEQMWISAASPDERLVGHAAPPKSVFHNPRSQVSSDHNTAFLLTCQPHLPRLSIDEACAAFSMDDLRAALGDFFSGRSYTNRNGRRIAAPNCSLPFSHVHMWNKFRIQQRSAQNPLSLRPAQTVEAHPPSPALPFGRGNTVLIVHESGELISIDDDKRYLVAQVRAILQPVTDPMSPPLIYVEFFNFSNTHFVNMDGICIAVPAPKIEMFVVQRRLRSNGQRLGDVVRLDDVRDIVQLVPKFGGKVSPSVTRDNSLEIGQEFYVNSFADKEVFHAILSYQ
ncbi:hypothetical protein JVU11DRAFT_11593 [Chiua virens]|nr:hypothetical protein JVU11DRAFT_11593 [Chiua virens]